MQLLKCQLTRKKIETHQRSCPDDSITIQEIGSELSKIEVILRRASTQVEIPAENMETRLSKFRVTRKSLAPLATLELTDSRGSRI